MPDDLLDYLEELNNRTFLLVEYGVESTLETTLQRINRGHTFADAADAIKRTAARGIMTGAHVILGLPGESHDDIIAQAKTLSERPLTTLKLHQLQLIKGTRMAHEYEEDPSAYNIFHDINQYIDLVVDYIEQLRPDIIIERFVSQSPRELLLAPDWRLKNYEITSRIQKRIKERDTYQGKRYEV